MDEVSATESKNNKRMRLSLDYRVIILILLAVIAGMLLLWKPWQSEPSASDRTISVTGETKVKATPDEYVFYPSYEFKNANKTTALAELTKKSDDVTAKLKSLGVPDNGIKTNSSGYDFPVYYGTGTSDPGDVTYTLQVTITVANKELAQKVQDYLITTEPTGTVSPSANFSETTKKKLESQARDQATKEARSKADQSAKNLGFKVGKVKTITDGSGFGDGGCGGGLCAGVNLDVKAVSASSSLAVQPGENELSYSVSVTYYIK